MKNEESEDKSSSSDEEEQGQAGGSQQGSTSLYGSFWSGLSQSSGQQDSGRPRSREELLAEMARIVREAAAQELEGPPQMIEKKSSGDGGGGGAFSGAGNKLGDTTSEAGETTTTVGSSASNANTVGSTPTGSQSEDAKKAGETAAREQVPLADGAPTTNIQFLLSDGSRLVARFNTTHTVIDLHSYINVARPQYAAVNYVLTLFPNTELIDKSQTLESAKLLNAALIQKIKQ